ncbi:PPR domain-containing protein/PPR_2 domain-containing protein/PPR_3 domain-containing protein [Cephalotus follicularis]|uniref:PPR domain-containing protein/PPR_2 domain-containing protein/PPR_3 domain-containing protein n=1 Tax=Cephalotus follicularis TaxID=3775 RepID=A0A1Q3CYF3_CEPFO|nr:PPR domain-containing protein/PPR_2 domain-containing protein/PPR_3 domain-containing protein [Cephalotus follicularis]
MRLLYPRCYSLDSLSGSNAALFSILGTKFPIIFRQLNFTPVRFFCTRIQPKHLCWQGSTHTALLGKLEVALKNRQADEAWETFNDYKTLFGFPDHSILNRFLSTLAYSSDPRWLQKAADLVLMISKEKSNSLQLDILTKLSLCLARAQMPVPASMILRFMLEKGNLPGMDILSLVYLHMVKSEIGTYIASNFLVEICDCFRLLRANKNIRAKLTKPDTLIFNLVLDACVRFGSSLKGQQLMEMMSETGVIADAQTIVIIARIHEMNGQRYELKKFKDHIAQVSTPFVCHYRQFYDSLLNLHFKFGDVDAAADLVLDIYNNGVSISVQKLWKDSQKPCLVSIGSDHLRSGLKMQILPELLQKDSVLRVERKQELVICRSGKLFLSNRALAKLISGYRRCGKIRELSKLLLSIQKECHLSGGFTLSSDVIGACIHLGWLETAHDILDDMKLSGAPMGSATYMSLLTAYCKGKMFKEANALLKQMRKADLVKIFSDEMIISACLSEAADKSILYTDASSLTGKSDLAESLLREGREKEKAISPLVYELNSSIYFFCKAKMIEDASKTFRRMQEMKIQPTVQTYAYLLHGYSSLEMYRDITILWGDMKRNMQSGNLEVSRDLYEFLLLNFVRGGYFERLMEVINHMKEHNMYTDKWVYKREFLKLHKDLYRNLRASEARNEVQKKRLEYVQAFRKWAGID